MNYPFWLVLMDADHIQDYIFGTNRLKEIRGASLLLDRLNLSDSRDLLIPYRGEEVFIGGGGILAAFPDEARARGYMNAVGALYLRSTSTATITGAAMEVRSSTHERDALCQARFELRLAKAARRQTEPILTSPYFRLCRSCGRYPATAHDSDAELCAVCAAKRRTAEELQPDDTASGAALTTFPTYSGYGKFARRAAQPPYDDPRWLDLSRVPAQLDRLEGHDTVHIGVIHADVNGLGAMLEAQDSLAAVHSLGLNVEAALEAALVEAARTVHLEPDVRHNRWPFLIIIMGGDDLTLIVPAGRAVALANALCLAFEGQIREKLGEAPGAAGNQKPQLALSAGVVIAKPKHPAYALADLAEQLTRNAKRLSHELKLKGFGPVPTLDFHPLSVLG